MTVSQLLSDEELRLREFPVARDKVFLAHAGVCPLPYRVAEAIRAYAELCTQGDQESLQPALRMPETRALAARLLGVTAEEIAFVGPTSLALSYVASGLKFRKTDNILVYFDDYPSNVYPWMALADRGVQVRFLNIRELGRIRYIDVAGQVDENTRLVALASCHFVSGLRIDVDAIGKFLRQRKILFCLDAIQTIGAFPTPLAHVDFMAADAHKWMLGPCAAGLLYVRRELQDQLKPPVFGWHNVRCPNFTAQESLTLLPDARRYEAGSANLLGLVGLHTALEMLLELGVDQIAAELLRKRALLVKGLSQRGCEVLCHDAPPAQASGIVTFHRPGHDTATIHRKLLDARIVTSLRADRSGKQYIRLSPHFYNSDRELEQLLAQL